MYAAIIEKTSFSYTFLPSLPPYRFIFTGKNGRKPLDNRVAPGLLPLRVTIIKEQQENSSLPTVKTGQKRKKRKKRRFIFRP